MDTSSYKEPVGAAGSYEEVGIPVFPVASRAQGGIVARNPQLCGIRDYTEDAGGRRVVWPYGNDAIR